MVGQYANREVEPMVWLGGIDPHSLTRGERCAAWLAYQYGLDPREIAGPEHNDIILSYSRHCRRLGVFDGVDEEGFPLWTGGFSVALVTDDSDSPWCAALQSEALRVSMLLGERPPHGLRVSARELAEDGRHAGTLRFDWPCTVGSVILCARWTIVKGKRVLGDPLKGGPGHVRSPILINGDRYYGIGGNENDKIGIGWHSRKDPLYRAWIDRD